MSIPLGLARRAVGNYLGRRPYCASFELTYTCNARCKHCHRGPPVPGEVRASPEQLLRICQEIRPVVAIMSGGEPLLRRDLPEIIRLFKNEAGPIRVFVNTNASLLPRRYAELDAAGTDEFLISLDYPDERHDEFRAIPGLFRKIESFIAGLSPRERDRVVFQTVFQSGNFRDGPRMAELARDWGVNINFSAYTTLRTHDDSLLIPEEELPAFEAVVEELLELKEEHGRILTSDWVMQCMVGYFRGDDLGVCRAGERSLVVNPDGTLSPCGLIIEDYPNRQALVEGFTRHNTCTACFTSTRANSERPARHLFLDHLPYLRRKSASSARV